MKKFFRRLLLDFKNLWDAIIALIGGAVSAIDIAIQLSQWGVIKNDIILPIGLSVFLVFGAIAILRAKIELNNLNNTLPNIEAVSIPKVNDKYLDGMHKDAVGIEFINNPKNAALNCVAEKVYATIGWIDSKKNTEETNHGRWWFAAGDNLSPSQKQTVDIPPNGQSKLLQFAIKDPDDDKFKAWFRTRDGKDVERILSKKDYTVIVTLNDNHKLSWSFKYEFTFRNGRWEIKE
jgi:hypothetical protein